MMKKIFIFLVLFIMSFLVACSKSEPAPLPETESSVDEDVDEDVVEDVAEEPEPEVDAEVEPEADVESEPEVETESEPADTTKGRVLENAYIDPAAKDNTIVSWGFGGPRDELNRPSPPLAAQEKYGDLGADFIIPTDEKVIYLTFDEGYENGYTPQILDTLKEKGVKAVFFITKPYAESEPELVRRMIDEGHIVGNHSVHHPSDGLPAHDMDYQTHEVSDLHAYVKENFDYDMCLFRYPAGMFSEQSLAVIQNCGYRSVFWSFAHRDWDPDNQPDPVESLKKLDENLHPGAIYLLHAVSATNTQILGSFIDDARAEGYTLGFYTDTIPGVGN